MRRLSQLYQRVITLCRGIKDGKDDPPAPSPQLHNNANSSTPVRDFSPHRLVIVIMFRNIVTAIVLASAYIGSAVAFTGDATFFDPGLGACGAINNANDFIVALSPSEYAGGAHCFQRIFVTYQGRSVDATVVDLCPGCGPGSIDLSPAAFSQLASLDVGRIHGVNWNFE
ncbi:unnamed protein product [Somion occarium]